MRAGFGLVALLVALALVGLMTRKSLDSTRTSVPALQTAPAGEAASVPGTVRAQSQQIQENYKKSLESALNQPRPEPAD